MSKAKNKYSDDTILLSVQFLHTAFTEREVRSWLNGHCRIIEICSGHGSTPGRPPGAGRGGSSLMASSGQRLNHSLMVREDGGQHHNCFLTHSSARRADGRLLVCFSVEWWLSAHSLTYFFLTSSGSCQIETNVGPQIHHVPPDWKVEWSTQCLLFYNGSSLSQSVFSTLLFVYILIYGIKRQGIFFSLRF